MAQTDHQIGLAMSLLPARASDEDRAGLDRARDLQDRAREALASGQPREAVRLSLEARVHADRALALLTGLPEPDRVEAQIVRTGDLIDLVRERAEACPDPQARTMIRRATVMQARAEDALGGSRFLAALQLTMGARQRALRALGRCGLTEDPAGVAGRSVERTERALAVARETQDAAGPPGAREALARATDLQALARRALEAGRFEESARLTTLAHALARRAARLGGSL